MGSDFHSDTMTIDTKDAGALRFDVFRAGPADPDATVIALHGFPQGARSYEKVAGLLADRGIALIAPDLRGYSPGARPEGVGYYSDDVLSADVMAIAGVLGLERFHLAGHDWGANIAWVTAAAHPDRITTLTAISVPHPSAFARALATSPGQVARSAYVALFRTPVIAESTLLAGDGALLRAALEDVDPAMKDYYVGRLQEDGALTAALNYYRAVRPSSAMTPSVTVPTTYVWSDADRALGEAGAKRCGDYVTGDYNFVRLSGVTHWVPETAPEALADAMAARILGAG